MQLVVARSTHFDELRHAIGTTPGERAFLSVLANAERETLIGLLKRFYENLPAVKSATERYVQRTFPGVRGRDRARAGDTED